MSFTEDPTEEFYEKDLVEIGWLLFPCGADAPMEEAAAARADVLDRLSNCFPGFHWVIPEARHVLQECDEYVEPVTLLELAERERDRHGWDYAIAVTDADLRSHLKSFTIGTPSRALGVAVLSTARLDEAQRSSASRARHSSTLRHRIAALALHLLGDLNGLDHVEEPTDYMHAPGSVDDLDPMTEYGARSLQQFREMLGPVADPRLEEAGPAAADDLRFYLRAFWHNRREIGGAVWRSKPWQFPYRLSKLTTAAASTMTVLLISAEAWELGMTQPTSTVVVLSILALLLTSAFVVARQRILARRHHRGLTEQRAVSGVAVILSVFLGMITTYAALFLATLALSMTLFSPAVANAWAAALEGQIQFGHYLILSGFVAMLGLAIGALGATFETYDYFRHIALVDEET